MHACMYVHAHVPFQGLGDAESCANRYIVIIIIIFYGKGCQERKCVELVKVVKNAFMAKVVNITSV